MDKKSMLDLILEIRIDDVATLSDEERRLMTISTNHSDALLTFLKEKLSPEDYKHTEELFDDFFENFMCEIGATNDKYYKNGFSDAFELTVDTLSYSKSRGN